MHPISHVITTNLHISSYSSTGNTFSVIINTNNNLQQYSSGHRRVGHEMIHIALSYIMSQYPYYSYSVGRS